MTVTKVTQEGAISMGIGVFVLDKTYEISYNSLLLRNTGIGEIGS